MAGAVAGAVDQPQHFPRVGQRDEQWVITPEALVRDVHALFALAAGADQRAIGIQARFGKELFRLPGPNFLSHGIERRVQLRQVALGEPPAEVARRRRVRLIL